MGMAKACSNISKFKHSEGDDVEQSLELLDKVLSEFEDPDSLPPASDLESPMQGLQSEDDGYMSMNDRRSKSSSGFPQTRDEVPMAKNFSLQISSSGLIQQHSSTDTESLNNKNEEENINSNFSFISPNAQNNHRNDFNSTELQTEIKAYKESGTDTTPSQTTLPKTRPLTVIPSRYASLPNASPPRHLIVPNNDNDNVLNGGRTVLGINISAVHDAVLRGITRMPESIVNEHPVTIYPGRSSPPKRVSPRTIQMERLHRDVSRKSMNDSVKKSPSPSPSPPPPPPPPHSHSSILHDSNDSKMRTPFSIANIPPFQTVNQRNNLKKSGRDKSDNFDKQEKQRQDKQHENSDNSDSDEFSDDSLEGVSLPPPPPPPVVPPPPSLSAPATPSKRGCIAWEIMLDDKNIKNENPKKHSVQWEKKLLVQRSTSISDSTTSLVTTSGNSANCTKSADGIGLPEIPICSTEDEAASLHSDSDDVIPYSGGFKNHGTYVISKGHKKRHALSELTSVSNSIKHENEDNFEIKPSLFSSNIGLPYSRHSIDLGSPQPVQNIINFPRSRLSLDLSSPTSELPAITHPTTNTSVISPRFSEFTTYNPTHNGFHENNNSKDCIDGSNNNNNNNNNMALPIMRVSSLTALLPAQSDERLSTPRRELAPPIEEDEDQDSEVQRTAPLRQIENNISALLRGDISVARVGDIPQPRRPLGFRAGVHKSESAKEMLLFQNIFGPLPPSPPSSTEESDGFPPLPPSPQDDLRDDMIVITNGLHKSSLTPRNERSYRDIIGTEERPPAIPPHRGPSLNTLKTRSMESEFIKSNRMNGPSYTSLHDVHGYNSRRRMMSGAFPKRSIHSPREEKRLQTSCSLPETPIFARGCDVPRTPHRRSHEPPLLNGSRTAPRQNTGMNPSNVCVGNTINSRQRSISQALAGGELLRQAGGPARGWYPRQRHPRPASTENLNRLHPQGSIRAWDMNTNSRKPLTLPPNLTPKFFNKSPREALRRVTSLLIRKGASKNENKREKDPFTNVVLAPTVPTGTEEKPVSSQKKKGFFKSFWKKSRHYSLEK